MTTNFANKTSLKVPFQLPEFIRADTNYETFVAFIQAYYECMEQQNIGSGKEGVIYGTQNLLNYQNIDFTEPGEQFNKFIDYYINDFLPNFPKDALADKSKLVKIARNLYESKGTPASYQFLFRALFNSDAQIFLTRDVVLRASDGKWYVSKSLRLGTNDEQFLSINNLRVFGLTSKSFATVERSIRVGNRIEVYISNIERLFVSGEDVVVVDNNNQILYFKDGKVVPQGTTGSTKLQAKILGTISSIQINSSKRGQLYKGRDALYPGDPVVFYGGLEDINDIGATAYVYETTSGSLRDVSVVNGSYGYREDPNTVIQFTGGGGSGAIANVTTVDAAGQIDVAYIPKDSIFLSQFTQIGAAAYAFFPANTSSNLNATLANTFSFDAFPTYPIGSVVLNNGGGGYTSLPTVSAESLYDGTVPFQKNALGDLGILGPIIINTPGIGYANGDIINFENSAGGVGANATVTVNTVGSIISATYSYANTDTNITYPLGGIGYKQQSLPTLNVSSSGGSGAVLTVSTVLGEGATFLPVSDERGIGAITSFIIENFGEDYISAPSISLRVRDLVVSNVSLATLPKKGDVVYQGADLASSVFKANVDSIFLLESGPTTETSKYVLRTYNYSSNTKTNLQLTIDRSPSSNIYLDLDASYNVQNAITGEFVYQSGIRTYGNGAAQATARFLNGLIIGEGRYINDDGFPSSNQVLESEDYNNFTYYLTVQASFTAYKDILYKLLHPSGTKIVPFNALKSAKTINISKDSSASNSLPLSYYTGTTGSNATIYTSFSGISNNIVAFDAMVGFSISDIAANGSLISLNSEYGPNVYTKVVNNHLEPLRRNSVRRSQKLNLSPWTRGAIANVTISADSTIAPDGTTTADKIVEAAVTPNFPHFSVRQSVVTEPLEYIDPIKNPFCFSVYAKAAENKNLMLYIEPGGSVNPASPGANSISCTFDVSNGTIFTPVANSGPATSNVSAQITSEGSGWYRCSISGYIEYFEINPNLISTRAYLMLANNTTGALSYAGNTSNGIFCWGAQFEPSYVPTKYIETEDAEVDVTVSKIQIEDYAISHFPNVAYANIVSSNDRINITKVTDQYDLINNGEYSNTKNKLEDIVFIGDDIRVYANASYDYTGTVTYVSYSNNVIFVTPTPSFTANNANVWVGRNIVSTDVNIYNNLGEAGTPFLTTQNGDVLITQDNQVITLGI